MCATDTAHRPAWQRAQAAPPARPHETRTTTSERSKTANRNPQPPYTETMYTHEQQHTERETHRERETLYAYAPGVATPRDVP